MQNIKIVGDGKTLNGHIYLGIQTDNGNYYFFGKYPENDSFESIILNGFDDAKIGVDNGRYESLKNNEFDGFEKTLSITEQQRDALISYLSSSVLNPTDYGALTANCADWVNDGLIISGIRTNGLTELINEGVITQTDLDLINGAGVYIDEKYGDGLIPSNWISETETGYITPNPDYNIIAGTTSNDNFISPSGYNIILGGDGIDTISYASSGSAVNVDLDAGNTMQSGIIGFKDIFDNIEAVTGRFADINQHIRNISLNAL